MQHRDLYQDRDEQTAWIEALKTAKGKVTAFAYPKGCVSVGGTKPHPSWNVTNLRPWESEGRVGGMMYAESDDGLQSVELVAAEAARGRAQLVRHVELAEDLRRRAAEAAVRAAAVDAAVARDAVASAHVAADAAHWASARGS